MEQKSHVNFFNISSSQKKKKKKKCYLSHFYLSHTTFFEYHYHFHHYHYHYHLPPPTTRQSTENHPRHEPPPNLALE